MVLSSRLIRAASLDKAIGSISWLLFLRFLDGDLLSRIFSPFLFFRDELSTLEFLSLSDDDFSRLD